MAAPGVTGRATTPIPGQAATGECGYPQRRPSGGGIVAAGLASNPRGGYSGLKSSFGGPPPRTYRDREGAANSSEQKYAGTAATGRARRNSGSPEPGNAARNSWNLAGNTRRGGDRVKTAPMSARTSPISKRTSPPRSPRRDGAPRSPRQSRQSLQSNPWWLAEDGVSLSFDADLVSKETWREFDESVKLLTSEAAFLRGMVNALRTQDAPKATLEPQPARGEPVPPMPYQASAIEGDTAGKSAALSPWPAAWKASMDPRVMRRVGGGRENSGPQQATAAEKKVQVKDENAGAYAAAMTNGNLEFKANYDAEANGPVLQDGLLGGC
eukprot:gb/GFBE01044158.1/.p1 GENE.gb/GFBE01044158.1/~~gb/GFBE01044158.1/.p1  ORF type:complete len:326 (+),score=51.57 gb/GFBE01044158.1/:1-978(+)